MNRFEAFAGATMVLTFAALLGCAGPRPVPVHEEIHVAFDSRSWVSVYEDVQINGTLVQHVPEGSTADDWIEMIIQRSFVGLQKTATADDEMNAAKKLAQEGCKQVDWSIVRQQPGSITYAAKLGGCAEVRPPHEVGRFIVGPEALYLVKYQSKKEPFSDVDRAKWAGILGLSSVEDTVGM